MPVNHNGTDLLTQPTSYEQAVEEAMEYTHQTGNAATVVEREETTELDPEALVARYER